MHSATRNEWGSEGCRFKSRHLYATFDPRLPHQQIFSRLPLMTKNVVGILKFGLETPISTVYLYTGSWKKKSTWLICKLTLKIVKIVKKKYLKNTMRLNVFSPKFNCFRFIERTFMLSLITFIHFNTWYNGWRMLLYTIWVVFQSWILR